jgi:tetratricopeptide (TPR) repeat protein
VAIRALANPFDERLERATELHLDDPEMLVSLVSLLHSRLESDPGQVLDEAEFFYGFLLAPKREIGVMDEREFFLGELALIAGTACRILFRREPARLWFDRAEANFRLTVRVQADLSRTAYQRLALRIEERAYDEILELVPPLAESFERLGMVEDGIKCRFLEAAAHLELGNSAANLAVLEKVVEQSEQFGFRRLVALAHNNLFNVHANSGNVEKALQHSRLAFALLSELGNRVHLAKLQWNVGSLYRGQSRNSEAVLAYRSALEAFRELGMRGDVAAMHLVIADLLLGEGAEAQAEWEIRAALPIIEEEKMVPEGMAAYALLRESVRRRKIDHNALRAVHGYFQQ